MELLTPHPPRGPVTAAVFDFDGTLSLIREGWAGLMADLGVDLLREQDLPADGDTRDFLEDQMLRLSGKPSVVQMQRLADEVTARGGTAGDAAEYLKEFHRRLFAVTGSRIDDLRTGRVLPAAWAVPGAHDFLNDLRRRGVALYLASGTDLTHVLREAELLRLTEFFGRHVYAPDGDLSPFTKRDVFRRVAADLGAGGLVGFGDGYAETVEVIAAGGLAVGVASREAGKPGVNPLKRTMLAELGAAAVVADFTAPGLVGWLFGG